MLPFQESFRVVALAPQREFKNSPLISIAGRIKVGDNEEG